MVMPKAHLVSVVPLSPMKMCQWENESQISRFHTSFFLDKRASDCGRNCLMQPLTVASLALQRPCGLAGPWISKWGRPGGISFKSGRFITYPADMEDIPTIYGGFIYIYIFQLVQDFWTINHFFPFGKMLPWRLGVDEADEAEEFLEAMAEDGAFMILILPAIRLNDVQKMGGLSWNLIFTYYSPIAVSCLIVGPLLSILCSAVCTISWEYTRQESRAVLILFSHHDFNLKWLYNQSITILFPAGISGHLRVGSWQSTVQW